MLDFECLEKVRSKHVLGNNPERRRQGELPVLQCASLEKQGKNLLGESYMCEQIWNRFTVRETLCTHRAYRAYDEGGKREVFLKCWREDDERASNEIAMLTGIDSPYTPQFICTFEEEGVRYLAEEWIPGETLSDLINRVGFLSFEQSVEIVKALCDALSFLHWNKRGAIAFVDLKPGNIMIRGDVESGVFGITLVDYEAAIRIEHEADLSGSVSGTRKLGSCYYTAPEVIFGRPDVTCDIYSLGVILHTLLSGTEGYPGTLEGDFPCAGIIMKCIHPEPSNRYRHVGELKEALVGAVRGKRRRDKKILSLETVRAEPKDGVRVLGNYRKYSVMVDCNACFASEMAHVASDLLGLRTGVFAVSEKGQRNLEYYFLNLNQLSELVCEDYYPFIFDHQSLYLRTSSQWTERGLLHACSDKLFVGSGKLLLELPLRTEDDFNQFFDWCHGNFDLVLFTAERQDDPATVDRFMKYCSCIITTPLSSVEDLESYRDYYVSLADNKRLIFSKVRFVAWDYCEGASPKREQLAKIVGKELYLGEVTHSESRTRKKNRLPVQAAEACREDALQYEKIIERLIG